MTHTSTKTKCEFSIKRFKIYNNKTAQLMHRNCTTLHITHKMTDDNSQIRL